MSSAKRSARTSPLPLLRAIVPVALGAVLLVSATSVLAAPPAVSVALDPAFPQADEPVTFTATAADPDGLAIARVEWDFDGNGVWGTAQGAVRAHTFATGGVKRVGTRVTDAAGEQTVIQTRVDVNTAPRVVGIDIAPREPRSGQLVTFSRRAVDADGNALSTAWDTDLDGSFDDPPRRTYTRGGEYRVSVRVNDGRGGQDTASRVVDVEGPIAPRVPLNTRPTALISLSPSRPMLGQLVTFSGAGSSDFEGDRLTYAWETTGGNEFDDASGPSIVAAFGAPVKLRVTDPGGLSDVAEVVPVSVVSNPIPRIALVSPFPIVRIVGSPRRRGSRIKRLYVRAPKGSIVTVACKGKGKSCPKPSSSKARSKGRVLRFKRFERYMRKGTKVGVRVSFPGRIGKYTSFVMRSKARPARKDMCLRPGKKSPVGCPSG